MRNAHRSFTSVAIVAGVIGCSFSVLAADEETQATGEDSSAGLPEQYAKDYLIAGSTISPDKKIAVIYPTLEAWEAADTANHPERIKDYLVGLQPFQVLKQLDTKWPYFQNENHGGISGEWSDDSSIALITLDAKWGPRDVFLAEFRDGKLSRISNIARKAHDLLLPNFRKSRTRYNDFFDFVFVEDASFKLEGTSRVLIDASAETSPLRIADGVGTLKRFGTSRRPSLLRRKYPVESAREVKRLPTNSMKCSVFESRVIMESETRLATKTEAQQHLKRMRDD